MGPFETVNLRNFQAILKVTFQQQRTKRKTNKKERKREMRYLKDQDELKEEEEKIGKQTKNPPQNYQKQTLETINQQRFREGERKGRRITTGSMTGSGLRSQG